MFVSIIIPIYNVESYIADCLQSVMDQTMTEGVECILVDDCGQDNSMQIAEQMIAEYKGNIQFSILHHEHNKGLSFARNTGIKAAKGEYVYFLDSDDEITSDCLEKLTKPLLSLNYDVIIGDYTIDGEPKYTQKLQMSNGDSYFGDDIRYSYNSGKWMQTAWNKLYSTEFIKRENLLFKEGLIHEDELWSLEVASVAKSLTAVKRVTYIYRIRGNSITTSFSGKEQTLEAVKIVFLEFGVFLKERGLLSTPPHYTLYKKAFGLVTYVATLVGKNAYRNAFKYCVGVSPLTISDIYKANHNSIKKCISQSYFIVPSAISLGYYNTINLLFSMASKLRKLILI